jgi:hypothetical protein
VSNKALDLAIIYENLFLLSGVDNLRYETVAVVPLFLKFLKV